MPTVTYDDRSLLIDGKRVWLISGSIHYFRTPHELWRDRLLKAKRAGLNCIDTYVAWNFHETQEGKWDFTGDRDISGFVRLAGELGLMVILRPGPYICSEWDFGGLPAWLTTKPGMAYRTSNAPYTHYYDKYFRQVLPRLADQQVTHGGNIILIQNENEYKMTAMPDRLNYLDHISQSFRRWGFDIPIINCNIFSDPPLGDSIEMVNTYNKGVQKLKAMRLRQSGAPLMVTEFWTGWLDYWGGQHESRGDRDIARRAMEILGCGAQLNYYMWHGGTNFGFWGSHLVSTDSAYHTTSYDFDAPLAEGGGLTGKYCLTKLVNMLANHMGPFLSSCSMQDRAAVMVDAPQVYNLAGPDGRWAFVSGGGSDAKTACVCLGDGKELTVYLDPLGATAVPIGLKLTATAVLDYSNLMPLGFFFGNCLVLHGPEGSQAVLSINGQERRLTIAADQQPTLLEMQGLRVLIVTSQMAMQTWPVADSLVIGPTYVGETIEQLTHRPGDKEYWLLGPVGNLLKKKVAKAAASHPAAPKLSAWTTVECSTEPLDAKLAWQKIDRPRDVDSLGIHYGYVWYRLEIESAKAIKRMLLLPECADRATLYLNGSLLGVYGAGPDATRAPIAANFIRGTNTLTALVDNLGRSNYGPHMGELKGLYGHVYDARPLKPPKMKLEQADGFAKRIIPRRLTQMAAELEQMPVWSVKIDIAMKDIQPIHVAFRDVPHTVALLCNDRVGGFFPKLGNGYGEATLQAELQKGKNKLELLLWGDVDPAVLAKFQMHSLAENISQAAAWSYRSWSQPMAHAGRQVRHGQCPTWFSASFHRPHGEQPLFLKLHGKGKGQIFLNSHDIGRYWSIGPQDYYYLPEPWLADDNHLLIFDETGAGPMNATLEFRPAGPYR